MKINIAIRCTYKKNGADRVSRVGRTLDTEELGVADMKEDLLLTIKEGLEIMRAKGVDLGISAVDFDKFFEEVS